jgi:hypothetical protein
MNPAVVLPPTPKCRIADGVLALHADQIERYGGRPGIRDAGLLQSALGVATATAGGRFLPGCAIGSWSSVSLGGRATPGAIGRGAGSPGPSAEAGGRARGQLGPWNH